MEQEMITLQRLLISTLFVLTSAAGAKDSCSTVYDILERQGNRGYQFQRVDFEELDCEKGFVTKDFKLVKENTNEVIGLNGGELSEKAANVFYHLKKAKVFWTQEIKSKYVNELAQLTVRLDIKNAFSAIGHFKNLSVVENYNNAWTVPAGKTPSWAPVQDEWGLEIWFSPMKRIPTRELTRSRGNNPVTTGLKALERPVLNYAERSIRFDTLDNIFEGTLGSSSFQNSMFAHLGTIAITYGLLEASKRMDYLFLESEYYLETAMIPDIIYHEFAHVALSDNLVPFHSSPVIEGLADYFALQMVGGDSLYHKIRAFSANREKKANTNQHYHPFLELDHNADRDFVLSVLWEVKEEFEGLNAARARQGKAPLVEVDNFVYQARTNLNHSSDIMHGLTRALIKSCQRNCKNGYAGISALHRVFESKGF